VPAARHAGVSLTAQWEAVCESLVSWEIRGPFRLDRMCQRCVPGSFWDGRDGTKPLVLGKEKYGENVSVVSCNTVDYGK